MREPWRQRLRAARLGRERGSAPVVNPKGTAVVARRFVLTGGKAVPRGAFHLDSDDGNCTPFQGEDG